MKTKEMTTLHLRKSGDRSPLRAFLLIPFVLGCFALPPHARAVCQEGCLTNGNTVLGDDALLNKTGTDNNAIGFQALLSNTTGSFNTAIGAFALQDNTTGTTTTAIGAFALQDNTTGIRNTAIGSALTSNVNRRWEYSHRIRRTRQQHQTTPRATTTSTSAVRGQ